MVFIAKNFKIFSSTFFFGGSVLNIKVFRRENKSRSFFIGLFLGTVAIFILLDRRYVYMFVEKSLIPTFPFLGKTMGRPLVQISTVFAAGVLVQSAQFPPVVNVFYACLLVISGIWRDIFLG